MVIVAHGVRSFWIDRRGISMTEALLVMPLLILTLAAAIEVSVVLFQWNQTVKALQVGARNAVVSDPLVDISALATYPTGSSTGSPISIGTAVPISCQGATCIAARLDRLYYGGDRRCLDATTAIVGICDIAAFIPRDKIKITYTRSDLGYVNRPGGPIVSVSLEVRDLFFDFFILDDIMKFFTPLGLPGGIAVPPHRVSVTSEDLCSKDTC
ncbi:pilus assembly protein [Maribius pontilimi]|uniref:Pilus assembly protein n=1 Tax=Palleronia pontilimi TaxID=1964209 RepID=A0A934MHV4_9RHOB|nr:TadE/TadG family type IV pilus assembly protein [Palleronia pontilimi]MBJ3763654.1 pilus assembly protein [Palleronia pontilimi]